MWVCVSLCVYTHACRGQRETCRSSFSPFTTKVPRIELWSAMLSGLYRQSHLARPLSNVLPQLSDFQIFVISKRTIRGHSDCYEVNHASPTLTG